MYYPFILPEKTNFDVSELTFQKCIIAGNWIMLISFLIVFVCILINFGFEQNFSIVTQIACHISTIIFAASLKIGYVLRCVGAHGLGNKEF